MENIIEIKNVEYKYQPDAQPVLKNVSLSVKKGEFLCVLGHNGSGKSTLAKLINGLFLPDSGDVTVCGMNTKNEEDTYKIRAHAGMVFQNPDNQMVASIVEEDVAFGPENLGVPREELRKRVDTALKQVNMEEFAKSAPHKLSGGQKQRIAIAGVIAMEPEILILDESTAMLDPSGRQEVLECARRLNREKGITVIFITHFMEETVSADRLIVMSGGEIKLAGTPKEIFSKEEEISALSLEIPEVTKIARALSDKGLDIDRNILTVEELSKALCQFV